MEAAVRASFEVGANFCTIHAQCGREALAKMAEVEAELNKQRPFKILSVTVLTSFRQETLSPVAQTMPIADQVATLAKATIEAGLSGLVCSPDEVANLRALYPHAFLVTPGVRLSNEERGDQRRVTDPRTALQRGASALVVGRPICESLEPAAAAKMYYEEIQKA
jgi:orotidine-5'-phosphate decarboxylase